MSKLFNTKLFLIIILVFGACGETVNDGCGEVSLRILQSMSEQKYNELYQLFDHDSESDLLKLMEKQRNIEGELILALVDSKLENHWK